LGTTSSVTSSATDAAKADSASLASRVIMLQQAYIEHLGFKPVLHFELEGCYQLAKADPLFRLNYEQINKVLRQLAIDGALVPEYWRQQWEYVSLFNGQSPLKEAENLRRVMQLLPRLFAQQGVSKTLIKPVVWSGDIGQLAPECHNIFTGTGRAVHIPNAIQINLSAFDHSGNNLLAQPGFGETLQHCLISTSLACCLLYLPEPEAFERLLLKTQYGLAHELCSPTDISGGHQGSIALYKQWGKHNQRMGMQTLVMGTKAQALVEQQNWQQTARIEHRLGASSVHYDAHLNVIFALANLINALTIYLTGDCTGEFSGSPAAIMLPKNLYDSATELGAISLFEQETWFAASINACLLQMKKIAPKTYQDLPNDLGWVIKQRYLAKYQPKLITLA
jgi:hypothetical protein